MLTFLTTSFQAVLSFLLIYKYVGLFFVAFISSFALPAPASATLAAASGFASQGYMNIYGVLGITLLGSMVGDILGYLIARKYGESLFHKLIFTRRLMQSKKYEKIKEYIVDYSPSIIFFSRFVTEVSPLTNILSGLTRIPLKKFAWYAFLGELTYTLIYGLAGYFLGSQWENNIYFFVKVALIVISIGIIVNVCHLLIYRRKKIQH